MSVFFYSTNPCAICGCNGILLAGAKQTGLEYEFKFAAGMNADILNASKAGVSLPFFTDGKIFAPTADEFLAKSKTEAKDTKNVKSDASANSTIDADTSADATNSSSLKAK